MKQQQLSTNDWQLLSEYLDGQLSPRDRAALEKRMASQAELRAGLDELRQTRTILRSVSRQRVPRNFTLTPAMVQQARPRPWLRLVPALNFASAAAALAMVVVMVVGLLPGVTPAAAPAPAAMPTDSTLLAAPEMSAQGAENNAAPYIIQWGGGGYGRGGGGGAEPPAVVQMAPPIMDTAPDAKIAGSQAAPETGIMEAPATAPTEAAVAQAPLEGAGPILGVVPPDEAQAQNRQNIQAEQNTAREELPARQVAPANWVLPAVILAVIALAAGLASLILRRKARA